MVVAAPGAVALAKVVPKAVSRPPVDPGVTFSAVVLIEKAMRLLGLIYGREKPNARDLVVGFQSLTAVLDSWKPYWGPKQRFRGYTAVRDTYSIEDIINRGYFTERICFLDEVLLPPGCYEAVVYNLAVHIAPGFDVEPSRNVAWASRFWTHFLRYSDQRFQFRQYGT